MTKKRYPVATILLALSASLSAQAASLADKVFAKAKGSPALLQALSPADRQAIAARLPLALAPDGTIVETSCDMGADPVVSVVALPDGRPAVFVLAGNTCASGMTGADLYMVTKLDGQWSRFFGVPAADFRIYGTQVNGWPQIGVLGRSQCTGLWQFDGKTYRHARNVDERGRPCKD